jgi:hypothetical protein
MGSRWSNFLSTAIVVLAIYGLICVFRDVPALVWTPTETYTFEKHLIQVRSYPHGWWRKYEAMIDDWDDVLSGYDSPVDAFRAAQAHIRKIDKEAEQESD